MVSDAGACQLPSRHGAVSRLQPRGRGVYGVYQGTQARQVKAPIGNRSHGTGSPEIWMHQPLLLGNVEPWKRH